MPTLIDVCGEAGDPRVRCMFPKMMLSSRSLQYLGCRSRDVVNDNLTCASWQWVLGKDDGKIHPFRDRTCSRYALTSLAHLLSCHAFFSQSSGSVWRAHTH
jgi:hypothetical protein